MNKSKSFKPSVYSIRRLIHSYVNFNYKVCGSNKSLADSHFLVFYVALSQPRMKDNKPIDVRKQISILRGHNCNESIIVNARKDASLLFDWIPIAQNTLFTHIILRG